MYKRTFTIALLLILLLLPNLSFAYNIGDKIGEAVDSDMVVKIDGREVKSTNYKGAIYIYATELSDRLGYSVDWNSSTTTVEIKSPSSAKTPDDIKRGTKAGNVLYSDIEVKLDDTKLDAINIDGFMAISVDALNATFNSEDRIVIDKEENDDTTIPERTKEDDILDTTSNTNNFFSTFMVSEGLSEQQLAYANKYRKDFEVSLKKLSLGEKSELVLELPDVDMYYMMDQSKNTDLLLKNDPNYLSGLVDLRDDLRADSDFNNTVNLNGKNVLLPIVEVANSKSKDQLVTLGDINSNFNQVVPYYTLSPMENTKAVSMNNIGELHVYLATQVLLKELGFSEMDGGLLENHLVYTDMYGNLVVKISKPTIDSGENPNSRYPTYLTKKDREALRNAYTELKSNEKFDSFKLDSGYEVKTPYDLIDNRLYYDYYRILPWWLNLEVIKGEVPYVGEMFSEMYRNLETESIDTYFDNTFNDLYGATKTSKYDDIFFTIFYEVGNGFVYEKIMIPDQVFTENSVNLFNLKEFRSLSLTEVPTDITARALEYNSKFLPYFGNWKEISISPDTTWVNDNYDWTKPNKEIFNISYLRFKGLNYEDTITQGLISETKLEERNKAYDSPISYSANTLQPSLSSRITSTTLDREAISRLEKKIVQGSISNSITALIIGYFLVLLWVTLLLFGAVLELHIPLPIVYVLSFKKVTDSRGDKQFISKLIAIEVFLIVSFVLLVSQALPQFFAKIWFFFNK